MQTRALVLQKKMNEFINFELPELEDSEVLIKVSYSSLNYKDAISVLAKLKLQSHFRSWQVLIYLVLLLNLNLENLKAIRF